MAEFCEYADGKKPCKMYEFRNIMGIKTALTPSYMVVLCIDREKSNLCPYKEKLDAEKK